MYESMIAEALHTGVLFYLSGLLSLLAGLAIPDNLNERCELYPYQLNVLHRQSPKRPTFSGDVTMPPRDVIAR